jgi:hypothetical protein
MNHWDDSKYSNFTDVTSRMVYFVSHLSGYLQSETLAYCIILRLYNVRVYSYSFGYKTA